MIGLKKILSPTDFFPCSDQALSHALFLARQYGAELHMLHAIVLHEDDPHHPAYHFMDVGEVYDHLKSLASAEMNAAVGGHKESGLDVTVVQERGISAADVILEYAAGQDIDLIVMGTHGRRGLGHLFLGSVAEEVVRLSPCPVLTIREREEPQKIEKIDRVLVPVDFSEHARSALRHAREIAAVYGAGLQLLHVIETALQPTFYTTGKTSAMELRPDIEDKSKEAMQKLFDEAAGPEVATDLHVVEGHAARDIVRFAEDTASDLIVIATHGLTGIRHLLLGSVTEKVVRTAPCPVFTVKAFGKSLVY